MKDDLELIVLDDDLLKSLRHGRDGSSQEIAR